MARVAKQTVYTPKTIMQLLNQWDDHRPVGMNVPHNKTLRMYALPIQAKSSSRTRRRCTACWIV